MSSSRLPAAASRDKAATVVRTAPRKPGGARLVGHLPQYDVRVKRELAHRRFVLSLARQLLRLVSLHGADALAVIGAASIAAAVANLQLAPGALPALAAFMLVGLNLRGSYRAGYARRDPQRLITGVLIGLALAWLPGTLPASMQASREFLVLLGLLTITLVAVERFAIDAIVHEAYVRGIGLRRALVIARPTDIDEVMEGLAPTEHKRNTEDQEIVGFLTPDRGSDANALGTITDLEAVMDSYDVSELLIAASLPPTSLTRMSAACFERGVRVLVIPADPHPMQGWTEMTRIGNCLAYHIHPSRLELPALLLKRASDLVLASIGLALAVPPMLVIALCIKLESRGPVFFRQRRVGLGGREFMMWKFRSMTHEAEARRDDVAHLNTYGDGRLFKLRGDPRVTRVGKLLRRFSMDELPQLLNVIAGDMSLVGPRPPLPAEVRQYEPRHYIRLSVVPGMTGPWQVNGRNLITDFEEVVRLEKDYIERWSLRSDLEIMLRTVGVVLEGKGAY